MYNEPNKVRDNIIRRLRTEQENEVTLANNLLGEMTHYLLQMRSRAEEETRLLGIGVPPETINQGASLIGCGVLHTPFNYLGVSVGNLMSRHSAWTSVIQKLRARLSNWKVKTLSIGGRLTLLKSVLGASPLYSLSIFKAPKQVLHEMEQVRSNFFNGADQSDRKISWVAWDKTLASKKKGGLGISSFHALNRALLLKWVWLFISQDGSFWSK
ncbi:hypothetical protein Tco_1259049, partial [Tanacetum coccineum]